MPQWTRRQLALQLAAFVALLAVAPHLARAAAPPGPEARAFMTRAFAMLDAAVAAGDQPYGA
ncbi:MAG: hypothetical protein FJX53_06700, partial [Alphaproteobacteria bacterium]|nr:hypothetical protein [Alphaproteobacteria bacterium]